MLAHTERTHDRPMAVAPRTVAIVGKYAHHYLDEVVDGYGDFDVVFVESITHAFSKIKRARPDLVVLCVTDDDADGCRVLSMLALDRETSMIPVLTHLLPTTLRHVGEAEMRPSTYSCLASSAMN